MSLDIWLTYPAHEWRDDVPAGYETCARCGATKRCSECGQEKKNACEVAAMNITHNVSHMWRHVGAYGALYESDGVIARQTLSALRAGLLTMQNEGGFAECVKLNPENRWGSAREARDWLARWLRVCEENLEAEIGVWK